MSRLSYVRMVNAARWWQSHGGLMQVEVAALEPLLWNEGRLDIADVVSSLKAMGYRVSVTSNGSLLTRKAERLADAGLDLLRLSWHSMDAGIYRRVTGGGKLSKLMDGIHAGLACSLSMSINRVLMRNHTDDLRDQLTYADRHGLRIKLLDLYWTPDSASDYDRYYISPEEVLRPFIEQGFLVPEANANRERGRSRARFHTQNGALVEYKIKASASKMNRHCDRCIKKEKCLEGYGDYFRVFPEGQSSLCYLRQDLTRRTFDGDEFAIPYEWEQEDNISGIIGTIPLRFVLEGQCNFNCGFPDLTSSWCLKQGRGYSFPNRSGVINFVRE